MDMPHQEVIDTVARELDVEPDVVALIALDAHRTGECTCDEVGWCVGTALRTTDTVEI